MDNRSRVTGSSTSEQTVRTPRWLLDSVEMTWGPIALDAAANHDNAVCGNFIGEEENSLGFLDGWPATPVGTVIWCNPPYRKAGEFARVARRTANRPVTMPGDARARVIMLVMASIGTNWWRNYVHYAADVYSIGRITFDGNTKPFMRDLAILSYSPSRCHKNYQSYFMTRLKPGIAQNIIEVSQ